MKGFQVQLTTLYQMQHHSARGSGSALFEDQRFSSAVLSAAAHARECIKYFEESAPGGWTMQLRKLAVRATLTEGEGEGLAHVEGALEALGEDTLPRMNTSTKKASPESSDSLRPFAPARRREVTRTSRLLTQHGSALATKLFKLDDVKGFVPSSKRRVEAGSAESAREAPDPPNEASVAMTALTYSSSGGGESGGDGGGGCCGGNGGDDGGANGDGTSLTVTSGSLASRGTWTSSKMLYL
eukprot:600690-Pleurochrysis_carterae.AAC.2